MQGMLTVTVTGLGPLLMKIVGLGKGLEQVPERVSRSQDLKAVLRGTAQQSLAMVGYNSKSGTTYQNMKAESTADKQGIVVFEDLNADTWPKAPVADVDSPYALFALEGYAKYSFSAGGLSTRTPTDFLALWPELMQPVVVDAYEEEVAKELRK